MSTITSTEITPTAPSSAQPLAYRCSRCFQTRCSTVDRAGQAKDCDLCGHRNTVPEATADRISQGASFLQQAATGAVSQFNLTNQPAPMTTAEIMKQCRQKTIAKHGVSRLAASKTKRLLGRWIDSFVMVSTMVLGFVASAVTSGAIGAPVAGEEPSALYLTVMFSVLFSVPTVFLLLQCVLTAKFGRTVGKFCVSTKIIDHRGNPPGFLKGVVMRSWINVLLGMIPFYGLVDAIWIFTGDSNQCVHDLLAGTNVVDAT